MKTPIRRIPKSPIKWRIPQSQVSLRCRGRCMMVPLELIRLTVVQGHWKLPPKLTQSPARWRTRQFPHNLVCPWIVLRLRKNLRSAVVCIHTLQGTYLHSCMCVLRAIHSHRHRHVLHAGYLHRHIHALHITNNPRRVPLFQPIGDRTTFKIKPRANI